MEGLRKELKKNKDFIMSDSKYWQIIEGDRHGFFCLGCGHLHVIDSKWKIENPEDRPTVSPSVLNWTDESRCHLFIMNGEIQFLKDCTHALAGKTIQLGHLNGLD